MTETVARCAGMAASGADAGGAGFVERLTRALSGWLNRLRDAMKPQAGTAFAVFGSDLTPCAVPTIAGSTVTG